MVKTITREEFDDIVLECLDEITDITKDPRTQFVTGLAGLVMVTKLKSKLFSEDGEDEKIFKIAA